MGISDEIDLIKKKKGLQILQTNRWDEVIERSTSEGKNKGHSKHS
jgi:hypothetical protein